MRNEEFPLSRLAGSVQARQRASLVPCKRVSAPLIPFPYLISLIFYLLSKKIRVKALIFVWLSPYSPAN